MNYFEDINVFGSNLKRNFAPVNFTIAISKGTGIGYLTFPANSWFIEWSKLETVHLVSVHIELKFGLEVTKTLGMAMVLGSKLTGPIFFPQTGNIQFQKKFWAYYLSALCFAGLIATLHNFFLQYVFHIVVAFSVLIYLW